VRTPAANSIAKTMDRSPAPHQNGLRGSFDKRFAQDMVCWPFNE
jgi:hypothetical protein